MLLHHQFIRTAKKYESKLAIIDRTLNRRLTYKRALIGALPIPPAPFWRSSAL
ncbi:MAG: hypothetical protein NTU47_15825 [Ignavibacteriales bacterium]|nr:hypothetical protein [Ignavibacteriales bacterium]